MAMAESVRPSRPVEESLSELTHRLQSDVRDLVSTETALAKRELDQKIDVLKHELRKLALAAASGVLATMAAVATMVLILDLWMATWVAALVVTGVLGIAAFVLLNRTKVQPADMAPRQTVAAVRRDVDTFKEAL